MNRALRAAAVVAPAVALTCRNLLVPVERIVGRAPDDAVFYLVIARNLAAGRGFTFDGVDATTGFHPLWLAIVALLPTGAPETGFRALLALHGLVTVASALVMDGVLRRAGVGSATAGIVAACAGAWGATAYGLGMETALVALLGLAAVWVGVAGPGACPRFVTGSGRGADLCSGAAFGIGLLLGAARIDAAPLLLGAGRRAPAALLGGAVGIAGVLGFNRAVAGEWASTSARLKSMGTVAERLARLDGEAVWRHVPGPAVAAVGVIVAGAMLARWGVRWGVRRAAVSRDAQLGVAGGVAGGGAWLAASYLFNNLVGPWYFAPVTWMLVAAAAVVSARAGRGGALLVAVLVVALIRGVGLPGEGLHATVVAAAREVREATTPDARVIAEDFPGLLSWFSERRVFPADGLAAGPGYREALATGAALAWWAERGATHWMVTRRREAWALERPLVDRIAPPFLPVPPTPAPLDPAGACVFRVDPASARLFALYALDAGACR